MIYNQNMIVYSIHNSWAVVFLGVFDYFQLFSVKTAKIGCYDRSVLFLKKKLNFFFKKTLTSLDTFALRYFAEIYPKNFIGPKNSPSTSKQHQRLSYFDPKTGSIAPENQI